MFSSLLYTLSSWKTLPKSTRHDTSVSSSMKDPFYACHSTYYTSLYSFVFTLIYSANIYWVPICTRHNSVLQKNNNKKKTNCSQEVYILVFSSFAIKSVIWKQFVQLLFPFYSHSTSTTTAIRTWYLWGWVHASCLPDSTQISPSEDSSNITILLFRKI